MPLAPAAAPAALDPAIDNPDGSLSSLQAPLMLATNAHTADIHGRAALGVPITIASDRPV
jgi:hypothetical protein